MNSNLATDSSSMMQMSGTPNWNPALTNLYQANTNMMPIDTGKQSFMQDNSGDRNQAMNPFNNLLSNNNGSQAQSTQQNINVPSTMSVQNNTLITSRTNPFQTGTGIQMGNINLQGSQNNGQRRVITPLNDTDPSIKQNPFNPPQNINSIVPTINNFAPMNNLPAQTNNTQSGTNSSQQPKGNFFTAFNGSFNKTQTQNNTIVTTNNTNINQNIASINPGTNT
jgi:hypothetical protein